MKSTNIGTLIFSYVVFIYTLIRTSFLFEPKYSLKKHYRVLTIVGLIVLGSLVLSKYTSIAIVIIILIYIISTLLFYKNEFSEKFFFVGNVCFTIFIASTLVISTMVMLCTINNVLTNFVKHNNKSIFIIGFFVVYITIDISLFEFWKKGYLFYSIIDMKKKYRFNTSVMIVILGSIMGIIFEKVYVTDRVILGFSYLIMIFLSICTIMALVKISLNSRMQMIFKKNKDTQIILMKKRLETISGLELEKRILYHDLKNHLYVIKYLINNNELKKAEIYIEKLGGQFREFDNKVLCGNTIINGICIMKRDVCIENKIDYTFDLQVGKNFKFDDYELTIIFSNILDNAIEASGKVDLDKKRFINLSVQEDARSLIIKIKNSSISKKNINIMKTSKPDEMNHGIGFKSLMKIVNKYNGNIKWENKDYIFSLIIYIPI